MLVVLLLVAVFALVSRSQQSTINKTLQAYEGSTFKLNYPKNFQLEVDDITYMFKPQDQNSKESIQLTYEPRRQSAVTPASIDIFQKLAEQQKDRTVSKTTIGDVEAAIVTSVKPDNNNLMIDVVYVFDKHYVWTISMRRAPGSELDNARDIIINSFVSTLPAPQEPPEEIITDDATGAQL